jgi:ribonuclease P protein component
VKQRNRLKRRQDFDSVIGAERVLAGRSLVAFARPNVDGGWRVGITVSRRVRGAVLRNRLRRRLREVARTTLLPEADLGAGFDVVLIGRPAAADLPMPVLEEDAARVRRRLERRPE